jgi:hypothetical protein
VNGFAVIPKYGGTGTVPWEGGMITSALKPSPWTKISRPIIVELFGRRFKALTNSGAALLMLGQHPKKRGDDVRASP